MGNGLEYLVVCSERIGWGGRRDRHGGVINSEKGHWCDSREHRLGNRLPESDAISIPLSISNHSYQIQTPSRPYLQFLYQ